MMRRQSLRPRQIDVHARMRIIRSQEDLEIDEEATATQPSTTFEELVANLDETQQQPVVQKQRRKKNIPIPVTLDVPSYEDEVKDDFVVPTSYVRFQNVPTAADDAKVELDIDLADIKWLKYHPKYGDNGDPRYQITLEKLAQMLDCLEKASVMINPSLLSLAEAEEVFAKQLGMVKTPLYKVTVDVYNYWAAKRQATKRPLLRKNWPQTPLNDTNPHLVFRPREKERYKLRKHRKNDMEGYRKLQQLRGDFVRVRQLIEMVKRREQLKRLEIGFLEEMRTQALHELTDRSGSVREPVFPVDEDIEKLKKKNKKKKKKGLRDGEEEEDGVTAGETKSSGIADATKSGGQAPAVGTTTGAAQPAAASPASIENFKIASFLEYDASENYTMRDEEDPDLTQPYYPSYPMPSSHLMATMFSQPPKYRCRGRVGRGGRLVIDRIPVPPSRYYGPREIAAMSREFTKKPTESVASATSTPATQALGEAINSGHHAAILIHETSFRPQTNKLDSITSERLQDVYAMSDSEDELMEPLTSSVYESAASRKSAAASGGSGAKTTAGQPPRGIKYTLNV